MDRQFTAIPLLDGVHVDVAAISLDRRHSVTLGDASCTVLLPGHRWHAGDKLLPPLGWHSDGTQVEWPSLDWGSHNTGGLVTIRAFGLEVDALRSDPGGLADFDHAVGRWRVLVRDWLATIRGGPTDFLMFEHGDTTWVDHSLNETLTLTWYRAGDIYEPEPLSAWEFEHGLSHAATGKRPPIAWTLLTAAMRSSASGEARSAVVDAATAVEVALSEALRTRLGQEASSRVVEAVLDRSRMLGARIQIAKQFGLVLPSSIEAALVQPRNRLVHSGEDIPLAQMQRAVAVAHEVVSAHAPLEAHCLDPNECMDLDFSSGEEDSSGD